MFANYIPLYKKVELIEGYYLTINKDLYKAVFHLQYWTKYLSRDRF